MDSCRELTEHEDSQAMPLRQSDSASMWQSPEMLLKLAEWFYEDGNFRNRAMLGFSHFLHS